MPKRTTRKTLKGKGGKSTNLQTLMQLGIAPPKKRTSSKQLWNYGGNELTALRLDPYYTKRLRGKGKIKDFFRRLFGKPTEKEINAQNAEIMRAIQAPATPAVAPADTSEIDLEILRDLQEMVTTPVVEASPRTPRSTGTKFNDDM